MQIFIECIAHITPLKAQNSPVRRVWMVTILQKRKLRPRAAQGLAWSQQCLELVTK